ncbi:MAG: ABC transporter ATP-binding protein [Candidatus Zixiibacteriota bacterium]
MYRYLYLIRPYLVRYQRYFWWGLVSIAITNALTMVAPLILRRAINRIEHGGDARLLVWDAALVVALAVVAGIFRFLMRRTVIWASRKIEYDLRGDLFAHILKQDGGFFDRTPTGDIITRATSDVEQVRMLVGPGVMQGANTIMVALVAVPLLLHLDVHLALWALLPLPILAILTNLLGGVAHRRYLAIQESFSRLSASAQESLAGIRVIKAFATEPDRSRRFRDENRDYFRSNMRLIQMWGAFLPLMSLISGSAIIVVLYIGGRSVIDGRIDLGTLVAFTVYMGMLIWPMIALGWVVSLYQRGLVSLRRLATIFETKPAVADPTADRAVTTIPRGSLEFRHLSFTYSGNGRGNGNGSGDVAAGTDSGAGRVTLADISFAIVPGETVALAGPTGSGKSTVAHLIWRRYPVPDGTLIMGGVDANTVPVSVWRSQVALVGQEPFLFSDTLRANIAVGKAGLSSEGLHEIAERAALAKDVTEFPETYETIVGERGITLSGGQKQRVTLARALASDAPILILDDAFSAVDAETEQEITARVGALFGTRILILITHRLSTLRRVDRILFFDRGELVDSGTHEEMLARGGAYARWVAKEALREELERL